MSAFDDLVDDAVLLSQESQERMQQLWGSLNWHVDLPTQTFQFLGTPPTALRAHLVGSSAPGPNSWLWGWANPGVATDLTALLGRVRDYAATVGITEMVTPELPLTDDLPLRLTLAAQSLTGLRTYFSGALEGGSRMWLLLEGDGLELPAPDTATTSGVITRGITATFVSDHRRAVRSYAGHRGIALADADVMTLSLSDATLNVEFENNRITGVRAS